MRQLFDLMRQEIASRLTAPLNVEAQSKPHQTYEEKKALARWITAELDPLGLALTEPKTGRPSHLIGAPGNSPEIGRFQFSCVGRDDRPVYPTTSVELPALSLGLADLTRAPYGAKSRRSR